ncbi:hypothetical protein CCHL11_00437 [Colletotrichum chlorophyti]|uniref:Secreted protein n=1 Tax=Colletotrichum chlorophyti TaxID=708187 RepID=A0A1Q8RV12_9PEZI|nr:hypothetical protein CCHL11_00437 [Colletotrichum chlorophyti]
MGLSPPVFVFLIVLATVVPPLVTGALLTRFVCRNFRDAAGVLEPRPRSRWFGLGRTKSGNGDTVVTGRGHSFADSWPDLESVRTRRRDTPTPSTYHCIREQGLLAPSALNLNTPSEAWNPPRASRLTWSFSPTRMDRMAARRSAQNHSGCSRDSGVVMVCEEDQQISTGLAKTQTKV